MARLPALDAAISLLKARSSPQTAETIDRVTDAVGRAATVAGVAVTVAGVAVTDAAGSVAAAGRAGVETAQQARETVAAVHRLAQRADGLLADIEGPLRALGPGLTRLGSALDDPVVEDLPRLIRQVRLDVLPMLRSFADTQERVAAIAGSTERILSFVEDTSRLVGGLPGAGLLGRRRPPGRVITVEQVDAPPTDEHRPR